MFIAAFGYVPPPPKASQKGFTYVALSQILYLISGFGVLPETWFDVVAGIMLFVSVRCVPSFYKFSSVLKHTDLPQGLYPTLIVILVSIQMSPVEYHSTHSAGGMQFTKNPGLTQSSKSQHVYVIGREYASDSDTQVPSAVFTAISDEDKSLSGMRGADGCR